jgi:hypothetical protein
METAMTRFDMIRTNLLALENLSEPIYSEIELYGLREEPLVEDSPEDRRQQRQLEKLERMLKEMEEEAA